MFATTLTLLILVFCSYVALFLFLPVPVNELWFGLDETFIPTKVWLMPIALSAIGFIFLLVHTYLNETGDTKDDLESALQSMYVCALLWAPSLYISMEYERKFRYLTILTLVGVTCSAISILIILANNDSSAASIVFASLVTFQSFIDSFIWSWYYYKNV